MRKAVLSLTWPAAGLVLVFSISGCTPTQTLKGSGELTPPPIGYVVECAKNPALENCK